MDGNRPIVKELRLLERRRCAARPRDRGDDHAADEKGEDHPQKGSIGAKGSRKLLPEAGKPAWLESEIERCLTLAWNQAAHRRCSSRDRKSESIGGNCQKTACS
jgi:hypothetical protein